MYKGFQFVARATVCSVTALRIFSINVKKRKDNSGIILHFLREGYNIILLQELNTLPLLPHQFSVGLDKAKIFGNVVNSRHGSAIVFGPRIAKYATSIPDDDHEGLISGAVRTLPEARALGVFSVYSPPVPTGAPAPFRDIIERHLDYHFNKYPCHIVGRDFNCVIDPALDQHGLSDPHRWPWFSGEVTYVPARLVDTFRSHYPPAQEYTRYKCARWTSESRLDYIFASPTTVAEFAVLGASIFTDYTYSIHHPVSETFQCPAPILLAKPPPTPFVYRNLNEEEKSTYTSRFLHLATWCHNAKDLVDTADADQLIPAVDSLLSQMATAFHKITSPAPKRKHVENTKRLRSLVRDTPPPSSPSFSARIAKIQDTVESLCTSSASDALRKLHRSLVRGCKMKKVVTETLCPNDMLPTVVRDPATGQLEQDPVRVAKIFGSTLQHLGGDPSFQPPPEFVDEVLTYSPYCPAPAALEAIPYVSLSASAAHLKHSKPSKSGGGDRTYNYLVHLAPEPIKNFFHQILNRFLNSPMPHHTFASSTNAATFTRPPTTHPLRYLTQYANLLPPSRVVTYSNKRLTTPYFPPSNTGVSPAISAPTIYTTLRVYTLALKAVTPSTSTSTKPLVLFHCPRCGQCSSIQTSLPPPLRR